MSRDWNAAIEAAAKVCEAEFNWSFGQAPVSYRGLANQLGHTIRTLTRQPTTPTTGEDDVERVRRLLTDFYVSDAYDPNAPRHADVVKAAIAFTLAAISPTTEDAEKRELVEAKSVKPRLNDAIITAAAEAHFGKRLSSIGVDGISITADGVDWTFRNAFTRMWHGAWKEIDRKALASIGERS